MTSDTALRECPPEVSLAIFAWNEERAITSTLNSVFEQTIFSRLRDSSERIEILCVANGCTDKTAIVAQEFLERMGREHPQREVFVARVADLKERGKVNAWNRYVHELSAHRARYLFMMDADIWIHQKDTLWNMLRTLKEHPDAAVAVDTPRKHIAGRQKKNLWEKLSLAASYMTTSAPGQLCGQLYCVRAETARKIYIPTGLSACEDGFIKCMVSTDFLTHAPWPVRIRVAENAEHTFEAYTSPRALLKNQKRQAMGQAMVHIIVDKYLRQIPEAKGERLGELLRTHDRDEPGWLESLVREHLRECKHFWRLHPGLAGARLRRLRGLPRKDRLGHLPAALAGTCAAISGGYLAFRALKKGCMNYWPKAERAGMNAT